MAKLSGKNAYLFLDNSQAQLNAVSYEVKGPEFDALDVTVFNAGVSNYIPGLANAEMSISWLWDSTTSASVFSAMRGIGDSRIASFLPEGSVTTVGATGLHMMGYTTQFTPNATPGGVVQGGTIKLVQRGATVPGVQISQLLNSNAAITNTTTGTDVDDPIGAALTAAGYGFLIVNGATTDTYTFKIQHSTTAGSGYVDLITFTLNGQATGAEMVSSASGTINRYRRVVATRTAGSGVNLNFLCFFAHGNP